MGILRGGRYGSILTPRQSVLAPPKSKLLTKKTVLGDRGSKRGGMPPSSELLPPGSPLHWFDFNDTTTTFQDTAGTTPATASGESVARINNKGSASDNLIQATGSAQPKLSNTFTGVLVGSFDGGDYLAATIANGLGEGAGGWSAAYVAAHSTGASGDCPWSWETTLGMAATGGAGEIVIMYSGNSGQVTVGTTTADVLFSGAWVERTNNTQQMYCNLDASIASQSNTSDGPADSKNLIIGGKTTSTPDMLGYVAELVIWNTELTAGDIADWQTYTNSKYGITWA